MTIRRGPPGVTPPPPDGGVPDSGVECDPTQPDVECGNGYPPDAGRCLDNPDDPWCHVE